MPFRIPIAVSLLLSLLFTAVTPISTPQIAREKSRSCPMSTCVTGCCADLPCCARSAQDQRHEEQAPAWHRANLEFAALAQHHFFVLYALPQAARRLVPREAAQGAHTLPRLAATCIQLI